MEEQVAEQVRIIPRIDVDLILVEKGFYVFAPKAHSRKDLRAQYPELFDYPEFGKDRLKNGDALFAWFMRCRLSPFFDVADEKKLEHCVKVSYETIAQQEAKIAEFANLRFPDNIKAAMARMESFNTSARIQLYVYTKVLMESCKSILSKDTSKMNDAEKDAWFGQAKQAWKQLQDCTAAIEKNIGGGIDASDVDELSTQGAVAHFRQNRK